ncbi:hypothetical protein CASFOL_040026 [Castilleja foliolosa]|uniref:Uncharacterized protein n=1 Tax=Castilleja foliolosa TaxID=1961234 RepID=A0ABD3BGF3_9LAMI
MLLMLCTRSEKFEIFFFDGQKEVEFSLVDEKLQGKFRRKWVNYVGRRWAVFKTNLTTTFIYGKKKDEPPYVKEYEFLDKETWDAFVALRLSEEEKAKRLKAQQIQSHNKCPQRCSRGGYEVLTQKIIDEKLKARKAASDDPSEIIQPPSPPSRHEAWKRARIKPSGEYINPETSVIAEKIPKWVYPKCCQQDVGDAEYGLFVMRHMLEIIKLDITNSFEKVLGMEEPYSSDDIDDVRRRWAESFLEVIL